MLKLTLDQEIADLKEQLHQKNQELLACTKRISEADQKIQQVRVKFMPQFQPIEDKNKALGGEAKGIETMKQQYATAESRVAMVKKSADEDKKQKKEIVDTRKDELDVISILAEALQSYDDTIKNSYQDVMQKQATVSKSEVTNRQMYSMKKKLAEDSIHSKGIVNRIQVLEKTIAESNAIVDETSTKLPQLEQQKTDAVGSKNYKMAGQLTLQIKQLQTKKETATMNAATAQEELNSIRASSSAELQELEVRKWIVFDIQAKKAVFDSTNKAYLQAHYEVLHKNAITCRKASRRIEAIQRGDDTFRFACQALVSSLFDLTNAELTEVAAKLNLPPLGDQDEDTPAEEPKETAEKPAEDMFAIASAPTEQGGDMFASMEATPATGMTPDRAKQLAVIAEAQMEHKNNELDAAMADDKTEECDKLSEEIEMLEAYADELKKFAAGTVTETPVAPPCFDEFFASKSSAGDDLFLGMQA